MDNEHIPANEGKWYFRTTMVVSALIMLIAIAWAFWAGRNSQQSSFSESTEKHAARGGK